jgi:hypothetical protein
MFWLYLTALVFGLNWLDHWNGYRRNLRHA